jgi:hypothetical protein
MPRRAKGILMTQVERSSAKPPKKSESRPRRAAPEKLDGVAAGAEPRQFEPPISPLVEVRFGSPEEMSRAWALVPPGKPVVGLPDLGMVVDIPLLERIRDAGIPIYPSAPGIKGRRKKPADTDAVLNEMYEMQKLLLP